jgi:hypothetical protein
VAAILAGRVQEQEHQDSLELRKEADREKERTDVSPRVIKVNIIEVTRSDVGVGEGLKGELEGGIGKD